MGEIDTFHEQKLITSPDSFAVSHETMELVFATNNPGKLSEVRQLLPSSIRLLSLRDIDCEEELPETGRTLTDNARQKANYVFEKYGMNCFADDTGLEVDALGGRPGVYSARFAGKQADPLENMQKLLIEMRGITDRRARFRTVIALIDSTGTHCFEGIVSGTITEAPRGSNGFGYDPVFVPEGTSMTFAEITAEAKNAVSHRRMAIDGLMEFLKNREQQRA